MKARLIILVVVAAGLAVFFAVRASAPQTEPPELKSDMSAAEIIDVRTRSVLIRDLELNCEETDIPAELSIRLEVDTTGKKNRLYYYIAEAHGFFVETFNVTFYYKPTPESTLEESPYTFDQLMNQYLPAKDTLKGCIEVVARELELFDAGDDIGTAENWGADIFDYHRACTNNPDPMPPQVVIQCRD